MLKNYFKIAWRNLRTNKSFSFINITGLAVGMAGAMVIFTWIQNELTYDDFHANKQNLYKVYNRSTYKGKSEVWEVTSSPVAATLKQEYPEVKHAARVYWPNTLLFSYADKSFKATGHDVDKPFLQMFSFPFIKGDAAHALDDVNNIVITQKLSKKMFGDEDPMGKLVKLNNKETYKVTGVMENLPNNTQFDFEYLVSLAKNERYYTDGTWGNYSYITYVQLQPGTSVKLINEKIKNTVINHDPKTEAQLFLHPMSKWRLYSRFENGEIVGGRIEAVRLLFIIAGLILLIACINFMNLSTARSEKRAKEVGVRKVLGAGRFSLIGQFLAESVLTAFLAGCVALVLVQLFLPALNEITQKQLTINYASPYMMLGLMAFILFTGVLAGSYPAFFLSSFKPVKVLKGSARNGKAVFTPRKILVVTQFTVAIVLVVSTIIIYRQINFAQSRDSGYSRTNLIQLSIEGDIRKNFDLIKNELINTGAAEAACKTSLEITVDGANSGGFKWEGMDPELERLNFSRFSTSGDMIKTMGMKLIAGREVNLTLHPGDSTSCMLNETAIKSMKIKDPIGKIITSGDSKLTIVGVFKDFIIRSPYENINPMIVFGWNNWTYNMVVRLNAQNGTQKSLQLAEKVFKKYNPAYPFDYKFVDKAYEQKFSDQKQTGALAAVFAGLTIFISCLGLFGLAAYMAENRSKEIGIRKVLGASIGGIVQLLTKEFIILVVISIVIATPIGWWAMSKWLQDFNYRINMSVLTFLGAGVMAIVIALITVSFQAVKAALANPIKSIHTE
jgi:putative ABC transport system permease protein